MRTNGYMIVYAYKGDLRHFLSKNFATLSWKPKLKILRSIISYLINIHNKGYIHRDLHSGNILLFSNDVRGGIEAHIYGLGCSKNSGEVYGSLPYIAPEVLLNEWYKKESDIYSFGVIMSEISTGRLPFDDEPHDKELRLKIINGLRPKFSPETPDCYIQLSTRCMDADPTKRPTADEIYKDIDTWWSNFDNEPIVAALGPLVTERARDRMLPLDIMPLLNKMNFLINKKGPNREINYFIKKSQLQWIPFDELKIIGEIGKGGFGTVYSATYKNRIVALKEFFGTQDRSTIFLDEVEANVKINVEIYGITCNMHTNEYMMVCRYADKGDLKHYLNKNFVALRWKPKLKILLSIISDLINIHTKGYIHRDLHSGNVLLFSDDVTGGIEARICDLGCSKKIDRSTICGEIFGVLPYIAPEVLLNKRYKKESDIYSLGVIMTEMSTGRLPFDDEPHDGELMLKIINGLRPKFAPGTPDCYIQLSNRCMYADPTKRPTIDEIYKDIDTWSWLSNFDKELIFLGKKDLEVRNKFLAADKIIPTLSFTPQCHPNAIYKSRLFTRSNSLRKCS
ncbi:kinase-like domain-containing protein [Gigaspora rosea]|uniref:Kinase-like domain-containing protein n=1 Tax=Gigaspora rosea TaxID=44941 RepID=A0A397VPL8_9GLOM|nr:kinase-like domain-containing protein [Gigaspora rosea]